MDFVGSSEDIASMASIILLLLFDAQHALSLSASTNNHEHVCLDATAGFESCEVTSSALDAASRATLQHFRLFNTLAVIDEDLGFWVKPRSTTWFSKFLLEEYDDFRWIQMFRFTKRSVFSLTQLLAPVVKKKDTKYRSAIPVTVRISCTLFKLSHGASLLICSELFALGRSTVSIMLREVVHAINVVLRGEIMWPRGDIVTEIANEFQHLCGLPGIVGVIDGTHIAISKPRWGAADYYYFKSGGYTINCQAIVDSSKRFLDLYVGMPGSTNDAKVLRRSTLYYRGQHKSLWDANASFNGFSPYLLGDGGYPLLPWLMVPHRHFGGIALADQLFNRKLSRGRVVVENAFALLKLSFRELQQKSDLHVTFIPDVVTCCAILHNVLLKDSHDAVERLLQVLRSEDEGAPEHEDSDVHDASAEAVGPQADHEEGLQKRRGLGVFLALQRIAPP